MSHAHLAATPMDPYEWRESVLSTRSLSYLSTVDAFGLPGRSRRGSLAQPSRRSTTHDDSEYGDDLEMANTSSRKTTEQNNIPELPTSVRHSKFFSLPRELRDKIYAYCLTTRDDLPVEWPRLAGTSIRYDLDAQLLRTCRIVYDETAPLLYSLNTLTFHHPSDANMFVRAFASPDLSRRHVANLALHLKAQDTRLWMPYLMSTDAYRSLKADYPYLRELSIRYRSSRWNHNHSTEVNLRDWSEDGRLDEIIDGLRHIYHAPPLPPRSLSGREGDDNGVKPLNEMNAEEFMRFVDERKPGEDMAFKRQLLELHMAHAPAATRMPPTVKVVCACRVHKTHFEQLTTPPSDSNSLRLPRAGLLHHALLHPAPPVSVETSDETPPVPVVEGETFRGFTAVDFLAAPIKRLHDPDLGSAKVARTPFADREKILVALEIHCLDSRTQSRERR
ncbi:hypothetical protein LTS10_003045 [Elasticomyces elasticus]|nr:hypothetical protein LTS10_003045 [Elasticomyces elasticus]